MNIELLFTAYRVTHKSFEVMHLYYDLKIVSFLGGE